MSQSDLRKQYLIFNNKQSNSKECLVILVTFILLLINTAIMQELVTTIYKYLFNSVYTKTKTE